MEIDPSALSESGRDVVDITTLGAGDVLTVQTESGSVYGFTVTECVPLEDYPDLAFVRAELSRVSNHEPVTIGGFETSESPQVTLEGSCDGAVSWGKNTVASGRTPELTLGRAVAYRNDRGNLIMTSKATGISLIKAEQPAS